MVIKKTLFPLIRKKLGLFITLIFICTLGILFGTSFISAYFDFKKASDNYMNEYGLPDIILNTGNVFLDSEVKDIKIEGTEICYRYQNNITLKLGDKTYTSKLTTFEENTFSKRYVVSEVPDYTKEDKINLNLDYVFAYNNNINAGITGKIIYTNYDGSIKEQEIYVNKLVGNPEAIYPSMGGFLPQDKYDFGYSYINKDEFEFGEYNCSNQVIVKINDTNINRDQIRDELKTKLSGKDIKVIASTYKEQTSSYVYINSIYSDLKNIAIYVPLVFLAIVTVLIFLFVYQITKSLSHEFGIMMALGVGVKSLFGILIGFALFITLTSSLLGILGGHLASSIMFNAFKINYAVPFGYGGILPLIGLIAFGVLLFVTVASSILTLLIIKKETPKEAINNVKDNKYELPKIIDKVTDSTSPSNKIAVSSLFKNMNRTLVSIFAVITMFAVSFSSINLYQSEKGLITQLNDRYNYTAQMFLFDNSDVDEYENILKEEKDKGNVTNFERIKYTNIKINNSNLNYGLAGIENNDFHIIEDVAHNRITVEDDSIVLDVVCAEQIGAKVGDIIHIGEADVKVNAISHIITYQKQYTTYKTLEKILGSSEFYMDSFGIITNKYNDFLNSIGARDLNVHIQNISKYIDSITVGAQTIVTFTRVLVIIALLLGFSGLIIMSMISVNEQRRKFSIMKALGLKDRDVSKVLLIQDGIYILFGLIIGIPCSYFLCKELIVMASARTINLFFYNYVWTYFLVIALIILVVGLCHLISMISIRRSNIATDTRSRE